MPLKLDFVPVGPISAAGRQIDDHADPTAFSAHAAGGHADVSQPARLAVVDAGNQSGHASLREQPRGTFVGVRNISFSLPVNLLQGLCRRSTLA